MSRRPPYARPGLLAVPAMLLWLALPLPSRTFTDQQGREIEAEIIKVSGANVTLRLKNGRESTLPVERLSEADRFFVSMWKAPADGTVTPPPAGGPATDLGIDADKSRVKKGSTQKSDTGEVTPEDWIYEIKLRNGSRNPLDGLELSYRIYVDPRATEKIGLGEVPKFHGGRIKLERIGGSASGTVKTDPVTLNKLELNPDFEFTDGSRNDLDDDLEGIWIKVWQGGRKVAEYRSNSGTVKKAKWPDDEAADPEAEEGEAAE